MEPNGTLQEVLGIMLAETGHLDESARRKFVDSVNERLKRGNVGAKLNVYPHGDPDSAVLLMLLGGPAT